MHCSGKGSFVVARELIATTIIIVLFFGVTFAAFGDERRTGATVEVRENELVLGDLIVACKTLRMNGEITEDLLAAGVHLAIGNVIGKDLTVVGCDLRMAGYVGEDARLAAVYVEINGPIDGDLVAFGGNVNIVGDVAGDVIAGGGNVKISGNIQGALDARCGNMVIDGTIGRDTAVVASKLTLTPRAVLGGDLTYTSNRSADIEEGAQVIGEVSNESGGGKMLLWKLAGILGTRLQEHPSRLRELFPTWLRTLFKVSSFVSLLLAGIIIISLYRRHATMVADRILSFPLKSFFLGLSFLICVPIGALILCVTIVGLPIGLVSLATYLVFSYISRVYVALAIGREILDRITKQDIRIVWSLLLGLSILTAISSIPHHVGWVISLMCTAFGLGGMLITGRKVRVETKEETA